VGVVSALGRLRALDRLVDAPMRDELMEQGHARACGGAAEQELSPVDLPHGEN
jgi:hypothetical protein